MTGDAYEPPVSGPSGDEPVSEHPQPGPAVLPGLDDAATLDRIEPRYVEFGVGP